MVCGFVSGAGRHVRAAAAYRPGHAEPVAAISQKAISYLMVRSTCRAMRRRSCGPASAAVERRLEKADVVAEGVRGPVLHEALPGRVRIEPVAHDLPGLVIGLLEYAEHRQALGVAALVGGGHEVLDVGVADERGLVVAELQAEHGGAIAEELQLVVERSDRPGERPPVGSGRLGQQHGQERHEALYEQVVLPHPRSEGLVVDPAVARAGEEAVREHALPEIGVAAELFGGKGHGRGV